MFSQADREKVSLSPHIDIGVQECPGLERRSIYEYRDLYKALCEQQQEILC